MIKVFGRFVISFTALALSLFVQFVLAAGQAEAQGTQLKSNNNSDPPQDADQMSAADIRASYLKRYPFADTGGSGDGGGGGSESFNSYSLVIQPCLGGLLGALNALDDALSGLDAGLTNDLQSQIDQIQQK